MAGREVREYTNLSDPKDKKWGKGKDKIDDEDVTFQRMVAKGEMSSVGGSWLPKNFSTMRLPCIVEESSVLQSKVSNMQEVAGERGGYLHGRGALDSDDLLYLKEQMEAEQDAERLLRRTEKRAFAAFKRAANLADSSPASVPLSLRVEPKPKSGIRQQDLLKTVVEIKPKRPKLSTLSDTSQPSTDDTETASLNHRVEEATQKEISSELSIKVQAPTKVDGATSSLLGLAYESSDDED